MEEQHFFCQRTCHVLYIIDDQLCFREGVQLAETHNLCPAPFIGTSCNIDQRCVFHSWRISQLVMWSCRLQTLRISMPSMVRDGTLSMWQSDTIVCTHWKNLGLSMPAGEHRAYVMFLAKATKGTIVRSCKVIQKGDGLVILFVLVLSSELLNNTLGKVSTFRTSSAGHQHIWFVNMFGQI